MTLSNYLLSKLKLILIVAGISVLPSSQSGAQDSLDFKLHIVKSLSDYRARLIMRDTSSLKFLTKTIKRWQNIEPRKEVVRKFIGSVQQLIFYYDKFPDVEKSWLDNALRSSKLAGNYTEEELVAIIENSSLADLIVEEILHLDFPFRILNDKILNEIGHYKIKKGQKIAEIGAGSGTFSLLLGMSGFPNHVYINELYLSQLKKIAAGLDPTVIDTSLFTLVQGTPHTTNVNDTVDVVIIRNSLHHFEDKNSMLKSIRKILRNNGSLYITEYLDTKVNKKGICRHLISEKKLMKSLLKNHFKLVDKISLDDNLNLYHFSPSD